MKNLETEFDPFVNCFLTYLDFLQTQHKHRDPKNSQQKSAITRDYNKFARMCARYDFRRELVEYWLGRIINVYIPQHQEIMERYETT